MLKKRQCQNAKLWAGIGLGLSVGAGIGCLVYKKYKALRDSSDFFFIGDNKTVDFRGELFQDVSLSAVATNVLVDLSEATPDENPMTLYIQGIASNIDVVVPEGWNVKMQGDATRSQLDNATEFDYDDISAPLLFVDYSLKASGISVYYGFPYEEIEEVQEVVLADEVPLEEEPVPAEA